jgi:peptidoglycan LD-endopeptidase CwlK
MANFGRASTRRLDTCHPDLQKVFNEVIKIVDCSILCGHRNKEDQNEAVRQGRSKVSWPRGKHNTTPSEAVDVAPYPIDWQDRERFYFFAGVVLAVARQQGVDIRWGGDWNSNNDFKDQTFFDLPHFELRK